MVKFAQGYYCIEGSQGTYRVSTPIIEHMLTIKHPNSSVGTSSLTNAHDLVTIQAIT
jgi:hypothetical protein